MRAIFTFVLTVVSCCAMGCGNSPTADPVSQVTDHGSPATDAENETPGFVAKHPEKSYHDPGQAVSDFLVAVKAGEEETATSLLTTAAQKEAWTSGLAISGEGFPDANFDVSEVELLKEDTEAHVLSVWSDTTPYGERKSFECVWLLRHEQHGWCIYGMATKFLPELPPVLLNFENQKEMQQRQRWAEQQIAQHRQREVEQQAKAQQGNPEPVRQASRPSATTLK